ncbi:MAG: peptidyl-prolyl cis-trans isomerase [Zoogloeaceae bacterium]|jgi:peptidyl-prolyl cis-trans isomerase A (cyclophilin A)|nr:peptidyl-prolyl cis-trans isomerase [Zoogloeaceae bacterium]
MRTFLFSLFLLLSLDAAAAGSTASPGATKSHASVELETSQGKIVLELDAKKAPKTVENFLQYAREGFYNGTIFHRVIPGFMIQGGGFTPDMAEKPTRPPIENEAKNRLKNQRGSIAMARLPDPHSASAQFFINLVDNRNLDFPSFDGWGYTVFGKVTEGMDVVDKIAKSATGRQGPHENVPREPIIIKSVSIISEEGSTP